MRILETERLILKPIEESDLDYLMNLRWDKEVGNYIIHQAISKKDQLNWYNNIKNDLALSVFLKENNTLKIIGTTGLYNIDYRHQRAIIKFRLDKDYQGYGYAYEFMIETLKYGFDTLNLNKIVGESMEINEKIIKTVQKAGFVVEGIQKDFYYHQGEYRNAILFGLTKQDFRKKLENDKN
jgi:ribosomal-protein-alanine N-acetyltransferase